MIRLVDILTEQTRKCPRCRGTGMAISDIDQTRTQCPECHGTGVVYWKLKKENLKAYLKKHPHLMTKSEFRKFLKGEVGGDSSGADNIGTYRSIAVDDPFAARIQLANQLRQFADLVESVQDSAGLYDPAKSDWGSEDIEAFITAVSETQKMVSNAIEFWNQKMSDVEKNNLGTDWPVKSKPMR